MSRSAEASFSAWPKGTQAEGGMNASSLSAGFPTVQSRSRVLVQVSTEPPGTGSDRVVEPRVSSERRSDEIIPGSG